MPSRKVVSMFSVCWSDFIHEPYYIFVHCKSAFVLLLYHPRSVPQFAQRSVGFF
jgi:hypothetical protein